MRHRLSSLALLAMLTVSIASAATFGRVVPIGGPASDIALDERRGFLYIANYTSGRIDVMSLADYSIGRSMSVAAYPGGVAISPDGHYLVVTHYASSGGAALTRPGQDAVTVIDLNNNNQKRTFGLSSGPVGVAFGIDGMALILTQEEFLLLDPASGATTVLGAVANVKSQTLPVEQASFPTQIIAGSLVATADGSHIFGVGGTTPDTGSGSHLLLFSYRVSSRQITAAFGIQTVHSLGPRVISVSRDGSYYMSGWALIASGPGFMGDRTADGPVIAQFPGAGGALNVGSVAIRSSKGLIYGQITQSAAAPTSTTQTQCFDNGICVTVTTPGTTSTSSSTAPSNLMVMDADNLNVRERIQMPENLAGKSMFNSDESVLYSISDSGVTVFPMAQLDRAPRITASQEDVVFRGNFCNAGAITQVIDIVDPAGNAVPFQIRATATAPGITITPSSGVTPTRVKVSVDPSAIRSLIGTNAYQFEILSASAVNMPRPPTRGVLETNYRTNVRSRFRVLVNNREPENRGAFFNAPGELVDIVADPARTRFYVLRQDTNQALVYDATNYALVAALRTGNTPTQMAITFDRNYLLVANDSSQIANRYDLNTLEQLPPIVFQGGHYPRSIAVSGKAILAASRVAGPSHTIDLIDLTTLTATKLPSLGPYTNDIHVSTTLTAAPNGASIMAAMPDGRTLLYNANVDAFTVSRKDFPALTGPLAASSFGQYMVDQYMLNESLVEVAAVASPSDKPSGFAFVDQDGYFSAASTTGLGYIQKVKAVQSQSPLPTMIVEAPLVPLPGDTDYPFRRTLAPLADRSAIIALTTSGFTVLPWDFGAATAVPVLDSLVNAGDFTKPVAPGGLVSIFGSQLSPITLASTDVPLPTVLADSCLTANGVVLPMIFVSPTQINAQLPFQISGNTDIVLRTPGGISDVLRIVIQPAAPAVFVSGTAGPITGIPTIVRATNDGLVTASNPIHPNDRITIYLTGMGQTLPGVATGASAPSEPLSNALLPATVTLGGTGLFIDFAGLTPGSVGVYQINALVPFKGVPTGFDIPLTITQGGASTTILVRVVN